MYATDDICRITDRPTEVRLGIYVNSFYSINEQTMVSEERYHTVMGYIAL